MTTEVNTDSEKFDSVQLGIDGKGIASLIGVGLTILSMFSVGVLISSF